MSEPDDAAQTRDHVPTGSPADATQSVEGGPVPSLGGYRLLAPIGEGAMGVVYRAEDPRLGRTVAIKVMRPEVANHPGWRDRFLREARSQARLEHPHVVPVYAADEEGGVPYLVMPLLRGQTLEDRLRAGPMPLPEAVRIAREVAEGIAAAHQIGLIHRDIKPGNLWLEESGRARLMDFGLARPVSAEGASTQPGVILGTPLYMAPEQAVGGSVDSRADLFSLGCVLYRLLTGVGPFEGGSILAILDQVRRHDPADVRRRSPATPRSLACLVRDLLAKDPAQRPPSAAAVVEVLRMVEAELAAPPRRRRGPWLVGGVALLLLVGGIALVLAQFPRHPSPTPEPPVPSSPPSGFAPLDPDWVRSVRDMPRKQQMDALRRELMRRNPGYDGRLQDDYWDDLRYVKVKIETREIVDLTPVQAIPGLAALECMGSFEAPGRLESLEPIRGLPLWHAGFSYNPIRDLSPLAGMPIHNLWLSEVLAEDFTPVYGLPLEVLHLTSRSPTARLDATRLLDKKLTDVWVEPAQTTNFHRLREIPTLKEMRGQPANQFWREFDASSREK